MPRVRWGDEAELEQAMDEWSPDDQIQPYDGPIPPNGLYYWDVKVLRKRQGPNYPQLMVGVELAPRQSRPDERKYKKYFVLDWLSVSPQTVWKYMPFLNAIGVTNQDFLKRTVTDGEGNVTKIGKWAKKATGNWVAGNLVMGSDNDGNPRKEINGYFPIKESSAADDSDEEYDEEEYEEVEYEEEEEAEEAAEEEEAEAEEEEYEEEEPPPPPRRPAKKAAKKAAARKATKKAAPATRRRKPEPEPDEAELDDEPPF